MASAFVPVVLAGLAALFGALLGWVLRGIDDYRREQAAARARADVDRENAGAALRQVQSLSGDVASHLQDHARDVEMLQRELTELAVLSPGLAPILQRMLEVNTAVRDELNHAQCRLEVQSELIDRQAYEAQTDALTKLPNRRALEWELQRRMDEFELNGTIFSVAVLDVDHFKRLNDTYGHLAGDNVLKGVAEAVRKSAPPGAMVARFGGEEFVIVLDGAIEPGRDGGVERCRTAISLHAFKWEEKPLSVTASLGSATMASAETYLSLLGRADQALYASKRGGRACSHWHDGRAPLRLTPFAKSSDPPARLIEDVRKHPSNDASSSDHARSIVAIPLGKIPLAEPTLCSGEEFASAVARRVFDWRRGGAILSVVMIRIDRLDQIRSLHGEATCESARRAVAQFVVASCRSIDHAARRDNGDLILTMPGVSLRDAARAAYRIHKAVQQFELPAGPSRARLSISAGVATCQEGDDSSELTNRCEKALEQAIRGGRDGVYVHNGAIVGEVTQLFSRTTIEDSAPASI